MRSFIKIIMAIFILSTASFSGYGKDAFQPAQINHLATGNSTLSNDDISALLEDCDGYLWIGTFNGLNRYNGDNVKVFKNTTTTTPLANNAIYSLCQDGQKRLWIGTREGITVYDSKRDKFTKCSEFRGYNPTVEKAEIRGITIDTKGEKVFCLTEQNTMLVYNQDLNLLRCDTLKKGQAIGMCEIDPNHALSYTTREAILYNNTTGESTSIFTHNNLIIRSAYIKNSTIYIISNLGIHSLDFEIANNDFQVKKIALLHSKKDCLRTMTIDNLGHQWIGTLYNGFWCGALDSNLENGMVNSIPKCRISKFHISKDGKRVYIGTYNGGLYIYATRGENFKTIKPSGEDAIQIWSIFKESQTSLLIKHSKNIGYSKLDLESGIIEKKSTFKPQYPNSRTIVESKNSFYTLSISDIDGLILNYCKENKYTTLRNNGGQQLPLNRLPKYSAIDPNGNLWLFYSSDYFKVDIDRTKKEMTYCASKIALPIKSGTNQYVHKVAFDKENNCAWIGTMGDGLFKIRNIDKNGIIKDDIENYKSPTYPIPSNYISNLLIGDSVMWIATEQNGVSMATFVKDSVRFRNYNETEGVANNSVEAIIKDKIGNIWFGTKNGLSMFNPKRETFRNFFISDGLKFNIFTPNSLSLSDSSIVMGGLSEIVLFNPFEIEQSKSGLKVVIENAIISNSNKKIIDTISDGDTITINDNATLSLDAIALHYSTPKNNYIRHRLIGKDTTWKVQSCEEPTISLGLLKRGTYRLEVEGANNPDVWGKRNHIYIKVKSSIWSWPLGYIILASITIGLIVYFSKRKRGDKNKKNEEEETTPKDDREENLFISKFYELIDKELDNDSIDINILARKLYLNRTSFFKQVKEKTGETPYELIKEYRLSKAAKLIKESNETIDNICTMTGFKNRSHFSKLFKEKYGVPPSRYKNEQ